MKDTTLIEKRKFKNPPEGIVVINKFLGGYDGTSKRRYLLDIEYDIEDIDHVNFIRKADGKSPIESLNGYCMSSGCSCRHPNGSKGIPICGLFKPYEKDGIKKDFIYQILGI